MESSILEFHGKWNEASIHDRFAALILLREASLHAIEIGSFLAARFEELPRQVRFWLETNQYSLP